MQKEVEIKIKVDLKQEESIKNWLANNAKFIGDFDITDYYLNNSEKTFYTDSGEGYSDALSFLRVRATNRGHFVTFKKREIDKSGKTLSVNEVETSVSDISKALQIFDNLGFDEVIKIQKQRTVYLYDTFEFAFDKVGKLGDFVEIELKNYSGDVKLGIQKIHNLLKQIGINKFVQYDRGYITIYLNPKHDFGEFIVI